jgi:hypothetical protein
MTSDFLDRINKINRIVSFLAEMTLWLAALGRIFFGDEREVFVGGDILRRFSCESERWPGPSTAAREIVQSRGADRLAFAQDDGNFSI